MSGLRQRLADLRKQSSVSSSSRSSSSSPETPIAPTMTEEDLEEAAVRRDDDEVAAEIVKWKKFRKLSEEEIDAKDFSLVRFWQVNIVFLNCFATRSLFVDQNVHAYSQVEHFELPIMFKVACDVLPVQASAVPCEHVFSSSKETCALRRNNISNEALERLQILKYLFKLERLTSSEGCVATEKELLDAQELDENRLCLMYSLPTLLPLSMSRCSATPPISTSDFLNFFSPS